MTQRSDECRRSEDKDYDDRLEGKVRSRAEEEWS